MLNLIRYEFRKARIANCILLALALGLEAYFLISYNLHATGHLIAAIVLLTISGFITALSVFLMGITAYSNELKQKTSFLIFMTPNSATRIMVAKVLYSVLTAAFFGALYVAMAMWDIDLLFRAYDSYLSIWELVEEMMLAMGFDLTTQLTAIGMLLLMFFLSLICILTLAYFAETLSATILQNKKGRGLLTFIFYAALVLGVEYAMGKYTEMINQHTANQSLFSLIAPALAGYLLIGVVSTFASAKLLEKKVSL